MAAALLLARHDFRRELQRSRIQRCALVNWGMAGAWLKPGVVNDGDAE